MKQLNMDWGSWLYGLFAGGIGGGAAAVYGAMIASAVSKDLAFGSAASFKFMGLMFAMSFVKDAALYLKQKPLPDVVRETTTETVARQQYPPAVVTTTVKETEVVAAPKDPIA